MSTALRQAPLALQVHHLVVLVAHPMRVRVGVGSGGGDGSGGSAGSGGVQGGGEPTVADRAPLFRCGSDLAAGFDGAAVEEQNSIIRRYIAWRNRHTDDEALCTVSKRAKAA